MKNLLSDFKLFYRQCRAEDFGFYMVAAYIIFSYLRPHVIFPALDIIPWTQICILSGLGYAAVKRKLKFQLPHFVVFLFFCACLLSSYSSIYPDISFDKIDIVPIWLLEILLFTSCINNYKQFKLITILFFLVLFKISFFGARTWVERGFGFRDYGIAGPSGYFSNSGELSLLMAMIGIMSLAILYKNTDVRRIYLLLPVTAFMTVIAASSRGGQLALAVGLVLFFTLKGNLRVRNIFMAIAIAAAGYMALPQEQKERFSSAGTDTTSETRLLYWSKGMEMFKNYPMTGVGYRCFPRYFHDHYADELPENTNYRSRLEVAHNTFIQVLSELGIPGIAAYLWVCLIVFQLNNNTRKFLKNSLKEPKKHWTYNYTIGLDIAQVIFFVGASFMSVALYPYNYFMIMFALGMNNTIKSEPAKENAENTTPTRLPNRNRTA